MELLAQHEHRDQRDHANARQRLAELDQAAQREHARQAGAGFSRSKFGTSASALKVQPPIASGASTAAASSSPSNGAAAEPPLHRRVLEAQQHAGVVERLTAAEATVHRA